MKNRNISTPPAKQHPFEFDQFVGVLVALVLARLATEDGEEQNRASTPPGSPDG